MSGLARMVPFQRTLKRWRWSFQPTGVQKAQRSAHHSEAILKSGSGTGWGVLSTAAADVAAADRVSERASARLADVV